MWYHWSVGVAMQRIQARVVDTDHLELLEPIELPFGSKVVVLIVPEDITERENWYRLSAQGLASAYGDSEPEYSVKTIREPNEEYRA